MNKLQIPPSKAVKLTGDHWTLYVRRSSSSGKLKIAIKNRGKVRDEPDADWEFDTVYEQWLKGRPRMDEDVDIVPLEEFPKDD